LFELVHFFPRFEILTSKDNSPPMPCQPRLFLYLMKGITVVDSVKVLVGPDGSIHSLASGVIPRQAWGRAIFPRSQDPPLCVSGSSPLSGGLPVAQILLDDVTFLFVVMFGHIFLVPKTLFLRSLTLFWLYTVGVFFSSLEKFPSPWICPSPSSVTTAYLMLPPVPKLFTKDIRWDWTLFHFSLFHNSNFRFFVFRVDLKKKFGPLSPLLYSTY